MNIPGSIPKLSIAHVIDRLHTGGAERVLVTLANIFYQHGHKVKVVTIAEQGPLAAQLLPGIVQVNLGRTFKFDPIIMRRLIKELKGFDVVHVHSFFNLRYLWLAKMLFGLKPQVFYHEHLGFRNSLPATGWHKYILPKTVFIATTAGIHQWAAAIPGVKQNRVFTLRNIVLQQQFLPVTKIPENFCRLVLVSNIRREKNIEFAISLLAHLNQKGGKYQLTIIGKLYDAGYHTALQKQAAENGVAANITWVHNADDVQQLLGQFNIGLHTSASESGPLAVIEYMAQGLPFLAYNTGEVITAIKDELPGCIAFTFEMSEWHEKLNKLQTTGQPGLEQQLKASFEKHFSEEAYYNDCLHIYTCGKAE